MTHRAMFNAAGMLAIDEAGESVVMDHARLEGADETQVLTLAMDMRGRAAHDIVKLRVRLAAAIKDWRVADLGEDQ